MSLPTPNRLFTCIPCRGEPDVSPQVGFSRGFWTRNNLPVLFRSYFSFPKTYSTNKLLLNISCQEKQFYNISLTLSFVFMLHDQ